MYNYYNCLKKYNSLHLNVSSDFLFKLNKKKYIKIIFSYFHKKRIPVLLIGGGSNIFFLNDFYGSVIINNLQGIKITENINFWFLHINSGVKWSYVVNYALRNGIYGLENLAFIPGLTGSAIVNNIGSYGVEISSFVFYLKVLNVFTGEIFFLKNQNCFFNYRYSVFKYYYYNIYFILKIGLKLSKNWKPLVFYKSLFKVLNFPYGNVRIEDIYNSILFLRNKNIPNPNKLGNVGSFFKNFILKLNNFNSFLIYKKIIDYKVNYKKINKLEYKIFSASLIERCNLKGFCIGNACIFHKHSLIIINKGNASSKDIMDLIKYIICKVYKKFKIFLKLEVKIIDFFYFYDNFIFLHKFYNY